MLDKAGFDLWADEYDKSVGLSDEENSYPFAGYRNVLGSIFQTVMQKRNASVLDIGFGTAVLTSKLYENGCTVYGQDFSERMLELASEKMPGAHLFPGDITDGLAAPLTERKYDFIIATYSLHHLTDEQKLPFLNMLLGRLAPGGMILIGDVAFGSRAQLEECRKAAGDEWDDEESYFVADELKAVFPSLAFIGLSNCAGVISLSRQGDPCGVTAIVKVDRGTMLADMLLGFVESCSWAEVKEHTAEVIRSWAFSDWETMFAAVVCGKIVGMASVGKTDYYPLPDVFPWVSGIFVSEEYRGHRISERLIAHANQYLKGLGFDRSYIPSAFAGLYEKYGYKYLRDIVNYGGETDHLFMKEF